MSFDLDAIVEADGIGIAMIGMLIVFSALVLISLFIAFLPKILRIVEPWLPSVDEAKSRSPEESFPIDRQRIIAAIGAALRERQRKI